VRVVSGGQTGVDRAALEVARELGLGIAGWCPAGRWAEDGPVPAGFPLRETPTADPSERTRWNVRDSDATLILARRPLLGGTLLALREARRLRRPVMVADPCEADAIPAIVDWLAAGRFDTLNIAGPRESEAPGCGRAAAATLRSVFAAVMPVSRIAGDL
jgi:hypothetical protein